MIAVIGDTHFGARADAHVVLNYQQKFFDKIFFPYLIDNNIKHVIHLGDLVDRRKYISYNTARRMRDMFLEPLVKNNISCDIIVGNHDTTFKNTNDLNALRELVDGRYKNINVFDQPIEIELDGHQLFYIPWITPESKQRTLDLMKKTKSQLAFGHLELQGFLNNEGVAAEWGDDPTIFNQFDIVMTGHFHNRITKDNIYYLGSPYQMTWADYNVDKGFHTFDFKTRELKFIINDLNLFTRINYNDDIKNLPSLKRQATIKNITDSYVKVVVEKKNDPYVFDQFLNHIEKLAPFDLKIVESTQLLFDTDIDQAQDTLTVLKKSIPELDISVDKQRLENLIVDLFTRAQNMDSLRL